MTNRLLKREEVLYHCGISASTLFRMIAKGEFPRQRCLSPGGESARWLESEIDEWVNSRVPKNPSHL